MIGRNLRRALPSFAAAAFGTAVLASGPAGCSSEPGPEPGEGFAIVRVDTGEIILSDRDLTGYDADRHELILNDAGIERWNSFIHFDRSFDPPIPKLGGGLYQKGFSVRIGGEEVYRGRFWSMVSSLGVSGVVMLDVLFPLNNERNRVRFDLGYPTRAFAGPGTMDPRNDVRIIGYFRRHGLLR
jgi:hypothetical protein